MCVSACPQWCYQLGLPEALTQTPPTFGRPLRHFPNQSQCCGWTDPCGYCDCKMHLSNNHQGTLQIQYLLFTSWRVHGSWGQTSRSGIERKRGITYLRFCLHLGPIWGGSLERCFLIPISLYLKVHSLAELLHGEVVTTIGDHQQFYMPSS